MSTIVEPIGNTLQKSMNLTSFLKSHVIKRDSSSSNSSNLLSKESTNTRIGDEESGIYGGNYHIPKDEYPHFVSLVHREIFVKKNQEYLTEAQMEKGPILVDLDLRHDLTIQNRQYTQENIVELIELYLETFKNVFQFDDAAVVNTYVLEKTDVNPVPKKGYTKDGIHLIISINCDHITQQLIRKKIITQMDDIWNLSDMKITNSWDAIFDEGISTGKTNWQMFGCQKPNHAPYQLTQIYTATFDSSDQQFSLVHEDPSTFNLAKNMFKLSARYPDHYEPFMTTQFLEEYNAFAPGNKKRSNNTNTINNVNTNNSSVNNGEEIDIFSITNHDQLQACLAAYLDKVSKKTDKYECVEAHDYAMTLPETYYGSGSYDKWFSVGCVLRNTSNCLFIVWLAFSAQAPMFDFNIAKLWDFWKKFDTKNPNGLTLRSLMYWSNRDAPEKYKEVRGKSVDYYIEQSIDSGLFECGINDRKSVGLTDYDVANVLYQLKKGLYASSSINGDGWYEFTKHRWKRIDSGYSLKNTISCEMRSLYMKKAMSINEALTNVKDEDELKIKALNTRQTKVMEIYTRLGKTNDKKNYMTEAKNMFYDSKFLESIDQDQYLLCCANGVWDFREGVFRNGKPEDYLSKSTNIDYVPIGPDNQHIADEINIFITQLFPQAELREYMWNHLASTLLGIPGNQTFNNYLGGGRNGKSVLVALMAKTLGEYKADIPLTAIVTPKRTSVGGLAPEIAMLKGARYVVMQEPKQGDVINEGILKELVSGLDMISARIPYHEEPLRFYPQFKLVVCANILPEIRAQDHGTWRRIRVVPFMSLFTENPVQNDSFKPYQYPIDPKIDEKFDTWKGVFLAMLVERVLVTGGAVPDCEIVMKASNEYKNKQDVISQFINEKIVRVPGEPILKKSTINEEFKNWHESNFGTKGPKPKDIHDYLDRLYGPHDKIGWKDLRMVYEGRDDTIEAADVGDVEFD
jgi:P4 family phage/plasmid primase-like protien